MTKVYNIPYMLEVLRSNKRVHPKELMYELARKYIKLQDIGYDPDKIISDYEARQLRRSEIGFELAVYGNYEERGA